VFGFEKHRPRRNSCRSVPAFYGRTFERGHTISRAVCHSLAVGKAVFSPWHTCPVYVYITFIKRLCGLRFARVADSTASRACGPILYWILSAWRVFPRRTRLQRVVSDGDEEEGRVVGGARGRYEIFDVGCKNHARIVRTKLG
jgi:hypothetical protein